MAAEHCSMLVDEHLDKIDFSTVAGRHYTVGVGIVEQTQDFITNILLFHLTSYIGLSVSISYH